MTRYSHLRPIIHFVAAALIIASGNVATARESKIQESALPAPVLAKFHQSWPKAKITGCTKEQEHGVWTYEIESEENAARRDVSFNADGTVREIEDHIAPAQLPQLVMKAMTEESHKWGKIHADFVGMERRTVGSAVTYEISVHVGKKLKEYRFTPEGTPVK